jgi:Flp pilus assembly protein TadD
MPCPPVPMKPMPIRPLGAACPSAPRIEAGTTWGAMPARAAVAAAPGDPACRYNLALACFQAGDIETAYERFAEAVRIKPDHAPARSGLGTALTVAAARDAMARGAAGIRLRVMASNSAVLGAVLRRPSGGRPRARARQPRRADLSRGGVLPLYR